MTVFFMKFTFFIAMAALWSSCPLPAMGASVPLVADGKAQAVVALATGEGDAPMPGASRKMVHREAEAAQELVFHLRKMSGVEVPIHPLEPSEVAGFLEASRKAGQSVILLGALARERLRSADAEAAWEDPSAFVVEAREGVLAIAGATPTGTACGVYAVLEKLGVRWYFPGELGTVVPTRDAVSFPDGRMVEKPSFPARYFPVGDDAAWMKRQRMGGPYFPPAHGIPIGEASPETTPELFALVNGVRRRHQLCISNPEVLSRAVEQTVRYFKAKPEEPWIGIGPADGSGFCECEGCRALDGGDWDAFSNCPSMTDRYIWFFNRLLERLPPELAEKKVAFYVYHAYMRPPVREKADARIVAAIAPIGLCRVHGLNNPTCPERGYLRTLVPAWKKVLPEVYERGYWFNLADPAMPFVQLHRLRDEIPYYAANGIRGFRTECSPAWALQGPSLYVAGRLLWDAGADVDALLAEFCNDLFGPAASAMQRYFSEMDEVLRTGDHHSGSAFNLLHFFPEPVRARLRAGLQEAGKLAEASPYKERVAVFSTGFAYSDAFAKMLEAQNNHDWPAAYAQLQEVDRLRGLLLAYDPPMLSERSSQSHLARFFRAPVEKGYARTQGGNEVVAPLSDQWEMLLDPQGIGQALEYFRPELKGSNWQAAPGWSVTWGDLGLRYYKGLAWYRQEVELPKAVEGRRVFLWFGGVDESARVWVNGKLLGTSSPSAFVPFEVDATEAILPGERNRVVICVANLKTNELGTGGLTAPGFFYTPAGGAGARVEELKPLRETFP